MISISNLCYRVPSKELFNECDALIYEKDKIAVVGANGVGKTSLFELIQNPNLIDNGEIKLNKNCKFSVLSQEIRDLETSALDYVLDGDSEYRRLSEAIINAESNAPDKLPELHQKFSECEGYQAVSKASAILYGLGIRTESIQSPVKSFSGGWRMRINLARTLMTPANFMLLDEPTNHLDMEALYWLEKWLQQFQGGYLLISHDRDFIDNVSNKIMHIENKKISLYTGNYSQFESLYVQKQMLQEKMFIKQQQKVEHLMSFVTKFKAKASKAKQAQSRIKKIAKMELIAKVNAKSPFNFDFFPLERVSNPLIKLDNIVLSYDEKIILKKINLVINHDSRIGLLGLNGAGKSTLIKCLSGNLSPAEGNIFVNKKLRVGYFAQHHVENLVLSSSPLSFIQKLSESASEQNIRDFLGGFGFHGETATSEIRNYSGGEKARLVLAALVWNKPNLLIMDEPTNHLDMEMRSALEMALQAYEGAIVTISHDRYFLSSVVDEFYLIHEQHIKPFDGNLSDYKQWLSSLKVSKVAQNNKESNYRHKRSLLNQVKNLELKMEKLRNTLKTIEDKLADNKYYQADMQTQLTQIHAEQKTLMHSLNELELTWIDLMEELDSL